MWIKQYEYHGEKAFEKRYTAYTISFKLDVLNYMNENGTSPNETAVIFNIPSSGIIRKWHSQFNETWRIGRPTIKEKGASIMKNKKIKQSKNKNLLKVQLRLYKRN